MEEITVTKKEGKLLYNSLRFVVLAMSKDSTRPHMMVVHVESADNQKLLVATDGCRLHTLTTVALNIDDGNYAVDMTANYVRLVKRISDDMPFPNWRRVIPEKEKTVLLYNELLVDCKELQDSLYAMYRTGVKIKTRYMTDLDANNEKQIWSVRQTPCDKKSALLFESGNRMAVIMPMSEVSKIAYPLDAAVKLAVKNGDVPDSIAERMDMSVADVMAIIGDTATPEPVMPEIVPVIEPEPVVETAPVMKEESATPETAPEQPKRKPRRIEAMIERHTTRRSAEQTPERGVWTPNRTGTKQILVCKW